MISQDCVSTTLWPPRVKERHNLHQNQKLYEEMIRARPVGCALILMSALIDIGRILPLEIREGASERVSE